MTDRRQGALGLVLMLLLLGCNMIPQRTDAQTADNLTNLELQQVVHTPTAGLLKKGQYQLTMRGFGNGGITMGVGVGLFHRFMFGVEYGGDNMLGYDKPEWNKFPGVLVKYRLIEETQVLPALTLGFDMQGHDAWLENRYLFKSPGLFAVVSRNFSSTAGRFGIHGGANYNTIELQADETPTVNFFAGIDFSFNEQLIVLAEYNLALDDNEEDGVFGEGDGYLNAGLRWSFAQSFALQFNVTDILEASASTPGIGRELKIIYVETFEF